MTTPLLALALPGGPELIFIFFIVLLLFGSKKLPELARGLGRSLGEFKKAKEEFEREIHQTSSEAEAKEALVKEKSEAELLQNRTAIEVKEAPAKQPFKGE